MAGVGPARIAAVTGAASGIGAAIAAELSNRGWRIAGLDLRHSDWEWSYEIDVADAGSVAQAVGDIERDLGPLDAVVSAAGHYAMIPVADIESADWQRMLRVHLGGAMNLARAAAPGMVQRGSGSIVAISADDRKGAVRALKDGESKLHDAASELASMKPPDDAVAPTQAIAKGVREIADQVTAVRKDAERGDFAKLVQFKLTLASDPAISEIRDAAIQLVNLGYNITGQGP